MIAYVFIGTVVGAEVACLYKFTKGYEEVVKWFASLLFAFAKVPSLHGFIDVAIYVSFDSVNNCVNTFNFFCSYPEILNN